MKKINFSEWVFIWDFDGTLVKTTDEGVKRIEFVCKKIGLIPSKIPSKERLKKLWGAPYPEFIAEVSSDLSWSKQNLVDFWREEGEYGNYKFKKFPCINEGLRYLKDIGVRLAILSSREKESILEMSEKCGLDLSPFSYVQGNNCHDFVKPDKRVFDKVEDFFALQGVTMDKLVYIGDTVDFDYKAALNKGLPFVAIASSFVAEPQDFIAAGLNEDLVYTDPAGLCIEVDKIIEVFSS